jgi:carbon storage regulator CsrA
MALSLSRKVGELVRIRVGDTDLWVAVSDIDRGRVRLAFDGPLEFDIRRDETLPPDEQYAAVTRTRRLVGDV